MAANQAPIYPVTPYMVSGSLAAATACTTRAPTLTANLAASNIFILSPISVNGIRVDKIQVQAASSSFTAPTAAQTVSIWAWDGTTAWIIDEFAVTVTTPSVSAVAFNGFHTYTNLVMPPNWALYISSSVTTTASTTALIVTVFGGAY